MQTIKFNTFPFNTHLNFVPLQRTFALRVVVSRYRHFLKRGALRVCRDWCKLIRGIYKGNSILNICQLVSNQRGIHCACMWNVVCVLLQ